MYCVHKFLYIFVITKIIKLFSKYFSLLNLKTNQDKRTSNIWQYFTKIDSNFATCDLCKKKLSYKTSVTNLKKHLHNAHLLYSFTSIIKNHYYRYFIPSLLSINYITTSGTYYIIAMKRMID